jgi:ABC transporter substrate binding protein
MSGSTGEADKTESLASAARSLAREPETMVDARREQPASRAVRGRATLKRRDFIALAGALVIGRSRPAIAQAVGRPYRIGMLRSSPRNEQTERFARRLTELGYVEGRDFVIEIHEHRGHMDRLPVLAAELVHTRPDVIIASGPEAVLKALSSATTSIPIVFLAVDYDPVALGYVKAISHPGGNLTGVFLRQVELTAKRLELLNEAMPKLKTLAVFEDAFTNQTSEQTQAANAAAAGRGLKLLPLAVPGAPP